MTDTNESQLNSLDTALNPEPAARPMPGFIQFMPPLVKELFQKNVELTLDANGFLLLNGFYDNGPLRLQVDEKGRFKAIDKRDRVTPIASYDDLVMINFDWWKITNAASKGKKYTAPNRPWLNSFKDKNLVKRSVIYIENDGQDTTEED